MGEEFRHKIIIDPVHGDIGLSKLETELIDTPTFQRLRGIKQLGFAYLVYPNARHSRFEHSLGVMHIMTRILESFRSKDKDSVSDEVFRKLRVAALLHDIGHYPYSHLMEKIDWDSAQAYITKKEQDEQQNTTPPKEYPKHEKLGEIVITRREDIREKLKAHGIDPKEIAALIKGQRVGLVIPNLLNASLDVDRLDYLVRDSINTGLPYGKVDLDYIVNNLELADQEGTDEKQIVVREKAKSSIEHMLMGRYFMFNTVYMHKTVFAFEEMVRRIVLTLWEKRDIYESGDDIEKMASSDSEEFLAFHDEYLDTRVRKYAEDTTDGNLMVLCRAVMLRRPPKLVYEISELEMDEPSTRYTIIMTTWDTKIKEFVNDPDISIPEECWIFRGIKGPEFEKVHPFVSLAEARELRDSADSELRELVKVKKRSGVVRNLLEDKTSVLHYLSRLKPRLCRVYVLGIDQTKAEKITSKIEGWLQEQENKARQ
ncbi:MAG: HD domain-containing protein [Planctomycetota bacterium]|jgi:HD superfamily phosphohydrolase